MIHSQLEATPAQLPLHTLQSLLDLGRSDNGVERRADPRFSFFAPVTLRCAGEGENFAVRRAFSREISRTGIGLILNQALTCGELYEVAIQHRSTPIRIQAQVVWCQAVGDGWYLAGCRFVDAV